MPKSVIGLALLILVVAGTSVWELADNCDKWDSSANCVAIIWIVLDMIVGTGLLLGWRLSYILLMAQLSIGIVMATLSAIFAGFYIGTVGASTTYISFFIGAFVVGIVLSVIYRFFRRAEIRDLYFESKT